MAERFETPVPTVYDWIRRGWLRAGKIGGSIRVTEEALNEFENRFEESEESRIAVSTAAKENRTMRSAIRRGRDARKELRQRHGF